MFPNARRRAGAHRHRGAGRARRPASCRRCSAATSWPRRSPTTRCTRGPPTRCSDDCWATSSRTPPSTRRSAASSTSMPGSWTAWRTSLSPTTARGSPREWRDRIFEPFVRLDDSPRGAGIGLFAARHLARAMSGDLRCRGPGACRLPVRADAPADASRRLSLTGRARRPRRSVRDGRVLEGIAEAVVVRVHARGSVAPRVLPGGATGNDATSRARPPRVGTRRYDT